MLTELDDLISKYRERYGEGKPYLILVTIRGMYEGGKIPNRIQRGKIIRAVWRDEIKEVKPALQDSRVRLLGNTFSAHKMTLNKRLRQMAEDGENPLRLGLVRGEVFGPLEDQDIEAYARKIKSPWLVEDLLCRLELADPQGHLARVTRRTRLKALEPDLRNMVHPIRADGKIENVVVTPGRKISEDRVVGGINVTQAFDPPFAVQETRDVLLTLDWVDAFRNQVEYVVDFVQFPRRGSTRIEIIFPSERPYRRYEALRGAGPMEDRGLDSAFVEDQRGVVEDKAEDGRPMLIWEIENPPHRGRHRLVWEW
ncbi:MAG: hypothetical protein O7C73_04625 [Nitrospirae bacterium]|nr:hypothetical protein [Nitrospirota bacterium]